MQTFIYPMDLKEAQEVVSRMAKERYVHGSVIIQEYLKYREADNCCSHFWPNQNSACFTIVTELAKLD